MHHRHKKDHPSGTALMLGKGIAVGKKKDFYKMKQVIVDYIPFNITPTQINEAMKENNGKLVVKGVLQRAEAKNQNGRVYPFGDTNYGGSVDHLLKNPLTANRNYQAEALCSGARATSFRKNSLVESSGQRFEKSAGTSRRSNQVEV